MLWLNHLGSLCGGRLVAIVSVDGWAFIVRMRLSHKNSMAAAFLLKICLFFIPIVYQQVAISSNLHLTCLNFVDGPVLQHGTGASSDFQEHHFMTLSLAS